MATFSERLIELRIEKGIKQKDLAEMIGVGPVTLNRWEKGKQEISNENAFEILEKLTDIFQVPLLYLIGASDEKTVSDGQISDEEASREVDEAERQHLNGILKMLTDLSPESRSKIESDLVTLYDLDKDHGLLVSQIQQNEGKN